MKKSSSVTNPVPCEVGIRRVTCSLAPDFILVDLTYYLDGKRRRVQAKLTPEQFALAITGRGGVMGTATEVLPAQDGK